jgi:hypothetical protein
MPPRPATKVRKLPSALAISSPTPPSDRAVRAANVLSQRLKHRPLRVRFSFVRNDEGDPGPPPLARLLRGGRGGGVRLKLLLSLLWAAGGGDERHKTNAYPARAWAALLDLPDPEGNGQRRIRDAVQWLEAHEFVRTERHPGKPMVLQLLREDGSGRAYTDPAKTARALKEGRFQKAKAREYHVTLPDSFWTEGWIVTLSPRAVAMLLVLADVTFSDREWDWASPRIARQRYGLSEDTWSRGTAELKARGIIEVRKRPVDWDDFEFRRVRNEYRLPRHEGRIVLPAPDRAEKSLTGA